MIFLIGSCSGLFRVPQHPLYLRNAEVLSHQTLRNLLGFSYIKNTFEDQLLKITRLQFDNWLFRPEKFPRLSRNRLQSRVGLIAQLVKHCSGVTEFRVQKFRAFFRYCLGSFLNCNEHSTLTFVS